MNLSLGLFAGTCLCHSLQLQIFLRCESVNVFYRTKRLKCSDDRAFASKNIALLETGSRLMHDFESLKNVATQCNLLKQKFVIEKENL